jgi:uncharacterized protein (TIGR02271 family)
MTNDFVYGRSGMRGQLVEQRRDTAVIRLEDGRMLEVPLSLLSPRRDGAFDLDLTSEQVPPPSGGTEAVVPVIAEELHVGRRAVPTGGVRVNRRAVGHEELIDVPLRKEHVDVRRVMVDRIVDGPLPVRRDGETTIVPIVEEVLVVQKQYRLVEEIHITKTVTEERHQERVLVQRQEAQVERLDEQGRAVALHGPPPDRNEPVGEPARDERFLRKRSVLSED